VNRVKYWAIAAVLSAAGFGSMTVAETTTSAPADMPHYGKWQSSKIGGGGFVLQVLATCDPQVYYCFIDNSGMYRSEDGGNSWRMLHGSLPPVRGCYNVRGMIVDPRDDKKIIAALGTRWDPCDGIYLSDDAGKSWHTSKIKTMIFDGADAFRSAGPVLARDPRNPDVVLAASFDTGVWRSTDNGMSWTLCGVEGIRPTGLFFDEKNPDRVWLCAQASKEPMRNHKRPLAGGFYESLDAGKTWMKVLDDGPHKIAQDPKGPNRLYGLFRKCVVQVSDNAGRSWGMFGDGIAIDEKKANPTNGFSHNALTAGPDFVLVGSGDGTIYRIRPGETTWQKVPCENVDMADSVHHRHSFGWNMGNITIDPRDANHWFFSDFLGIFQTHDGGTNWKSTIHGLELTVIHQVLQDPSDPAVVYVAMADCCFLTSRDGGKNFAYFHRETKGWNPKYITAMSISCRDLDLSPKDPNRLYAVAAQGASPYPTRVYVSSDNGDTWDKWAITGLDTKDPNRSICNSIAVDPDNPDKAYVTIGYAIKPAGEGGGGIYCTEDAGKSWKWFSQGLPPLPYYFVVIPWNSGKEVAAGPGGRVICISKFGGGIRRLDAATQSWVKADVKIDGQPYAVTADLLKPGRFFVGVLGDGLYRTGDGGVTWAKVYKESVGRVACDKVVPGRVAASTHDGVILSRDGGDTWTMLDKSLPDRVDRNVPAFVGERLVVGSAGSGVFWIPLSAKGEEEVRAKVTHF
jgi:photosystem II stability/assembly factor-like uncharacterized protein